MNATKFCKLIFFVLLQMAFHTQFAWASSCQNVFAESAQSTKIEALKILNDFGINEKSLQPIETLVSKMTLQIPEDVAWSQIAEELSIQKYISLNFFDITADNLGPFDPIYLRKGQQGYSLSQLGEIFLERVRNLDQYSDVELAAVDFKLEGLFMKTSFNGIDIFMALDIAHWLTGPYARIETSEELRKVVSSLKLEFPYGFKEAQQNCAQNNWKGNELREKRIFVVPFRNSPSYFEHWYLTYFSREGQTFIIDFSFNQFFSEDIFHGEPFVGTADELQQLAKKNKDKLGVGKNEHKSISLNGSPTKLISFFDGAPAGPDIMNFAPEILSTIQEKLSHFEKQKKNRN